MNEHEREPLNELASQVIGAAYEVSNVLGIGFLEKVYHKALLHELTLRGINAENEPSLPVIYKDKEISDFSPDLLVDRRLIVELKCADAFDENHMAQCLNYLKVTGLNLAILINFKHSRVEWRRIVKDF